MTSSVVSRYFFGFLQVIGYLLFFRRQLRGTACVLFIPNLLDAQGDRSFPSIALFMLRYCRVYHGSGVGSLLRAGVAFGSMLLYSSDRAAYICISTGPAIMFTMLDLNFPGDGLRDAFDPRETVELGQCNHISSEKEVQ